MAHTSVTLPDILFFYRKKVFVAFIRFKFAYVVLSLFFGLFSEGVACGFMFGSDSLQSGSDPIPMHRNRFRHRDKHRHRHRHTRRHTITKREGKRGEERGGGGGTGAASVPLESVTMMGPAGPCMLDAGRSSTPGTIGASGAPLLEAV